MGSKGWAATCSGDRRDDGQVGLPHAGQVITVELGDTALRVIDGNGELLTTVARNTDGEITRFKAHGSRRTS